MKCPECDFPVRRQRVPIALAPGTRIIRPGGLCSRCFKGGKPRNRTAPVEEIRDLRLASIALEGFMAERRARITRKACK
jgi:hypothetical protein